MNNEKIIIDNLQQIRVDARQITDDNSLRNAMDKYDMIFTGKKLNTIYSVELKHYLTTNHGLSIDHKEFLLIIPKVCNVLNMNYETLYLLEDPKTIADYSIELF
ncbi:hypothetical protein M3E13_15450 [Oceanobacillus kimchii]|uniref:hypothetical protein n=1 Tax=Oceanobacillus kimchii TaxID=746691 RepID=UPI0021A4ECD3|nr:hypothetical protein [Oceanobacillus kimchii]MCT1575660.1 hypothetical protein [Oceanobacillus kimchii]MCT2137291.1 hypothetical protein [Oceanobacillus kimchii]